MRLAYKNDEISLYLVDKRCLTQEDIEIMPPRAAAFVWNRRMGRVGFVKLSDNRCCKIPIVHSSVTFSELCDLDIILHSGNDDEKQELAKKISQYIDILQTKKQVRIIDYACASPEKDNEIDAVEKNIEAQIHLLHRQFEADQLLSVEAIDNAIKKIKNILDNLLNVNESEVIYQILFRHVVHACKVLARLEYIWQRPDNINVFLIQWTNLVDGSEELIARERYVNPEAFLAMEEMLLPRVQELLDMFLTNNAIRPSKNFQWEGNVGEDFDSVMAKLERGEKLTPKQKIYLYPNVKVGDAGALRLAAVLRAELAPKNWRVYLHDNDITDVGVRKLANAIRCAPKGFFLNLSNNSLTSDSTAYLLGRLHSLYRDRALPYNLRIQVNSDEAAEIIKVLRKNTVMHDRLACIAFHRAFRGRSVASASASTSAPGLFPYLPNEGLCSIYTAIAQATNATAVLSDGLFENSIFASSNRCLALAAESASTEILDNHTEESHVTYTP